ncbi:hypothetical protein K493DRAFT_373578 [Basidiobolus meristosporus CBS 931.73]|uniref:Uncharacterized protein n=1 Tax=Basidiobolus meristosporus CBS 931.73 TaxID=1314790 RepID=A0A1Y1YAE7_9FUNG|nr:hypothetical protein K493DRAFT_373578 [Basidiobolus meristosporus CBS 931.73]|eukprot:ORX94574.1 hypothetical protein K493DRAFT_373578 [Basidiobolus meristosporus CBS 931.73]
MYFEPVQSILPQIFTQQVRITNSNETLPTFLSLSEREMTIWFDAVQSYYFSRNQWEKMHRFTVRMMRQCGFLEEFDVLGKNESDTDHMSISGKLLHNLWSNPGTLPKGFECRLLAGYFVQLAFEYYSAVAQHSPRILTDLEYASADTVMIPIGLIRDGVDGQVKKRKYHSKSQGDTSSQAASSTELLLLLRKAGELRRHMDACSYGIELSDLYQGWKLPFDLQNAVDTLTADLNIMEGHPAEAIPICQSLSVRLKHAWEVQQQARTFDATDEAPLHSLDVTLLSSRWSILFPFRVIYVMAIAFLLDGQYRAAIKRFLGIICALPYTEIQPETLPIDREGKYRIASATPETLVIQCIHHTMHAILTFDVIAENGGFSFFPFFEFVFDEKLLQIMQQKSILNLHRMTMVESEPPSNHEINDQYRDKVLSPSRLEHLKREHVIATIESSFTKARIRQTQPKRPLLIEFCQLTLSKIA